MNTIELIEVRAIADKENIFNIRVKINDNFLDFETDLKNGVKKETEKQFNPNKYDFSRFENYYSREH